MPTVLVEVITTRTRLLHLSTPLLLLRDLAIYPSRTCHRFSSLTEDQLHTAPKTKVLMRINRKDYPQSARAALTSRTSTDLIQVQILNPKVNSVLSAKNNTKSRFQWSILYLNAIPTHSLTRWTASASSWRKALVLRCDQALCSRLISTYFLY